jgi:hypothetical protein
MTSDEPSRPYLKCVTDSQKIHNSPFNLSPSKQLYSFPKSKRFDDQTTKSLCQEAFYDAPAKPNQGQKGTSIGYGHKFDFTSNAKNVPAPNSYLPKNLTMEEGTQKKHGFTFGVSRDQYKQSGMAMHLKNAAQMPGPAAYFPHFPKSQVGTTLKSRINLHQEITGQVGPGQYEIAPALQTHKQLFNSKHRNAKGVKFPPIVPEHGKENQRLPTDVPGTLSSDIKFQINGKGEYFNSKYHNTMAPAFPKQARSMDIKKTNLPGPGDYPAPSEFGIYVSSKAA